MLRPLVACCVSCLAGPANGQAADGQDWRHRVNSAEFTGSGAGEWISPRVTTPFPFQELIYCWHLDRPRDSFRLFLKAGFNGGGETEWLYAGYWGEVEGLLKDRKPPVFDRGILDMDWLKLKVPATSYRFKVVAAGSKALRNPPSLTVVTSRTSASREGRISTQREDRRLPGRVLDIPLRRQFDSDGKRMKDRCQSAALASAMEYYGKSVPLEQITAHTFDVEYAYPGIWPRVIAAAREFGFEGYIDRFRDWGRVREALADNKVLLCSMRLTRGQCEAPPYASMGNHIVALCGVTDDGRVVVTDSALGKSGTGYLCQWRMSDFEKVWMETKGGVALVICPSPGAKTRLVEKLPGFPTNRVFPEGDDH